MTAGAKRHCSAAPRVTAGAKENRSAAHAFSPTASAKGHCSAAASRSFLGPYGPSQKVSAGACWVLSLRMGLICLPGPLLLPACEVCVC